MKGRGGCVAPESKHPILRRQLAQPRAFQFSKESRNLGFYADSYWAGREISYLKNITVQKAQTPLGAQAGPRVPAVNSAQRTCREVVKGS